ncbi:MAG: threonylcarbamoyl-AMP synthase, partial [Candidatus Portnoybacteria bacterium]|nr:threonylcarbamoyl-AMP synthase [Candidatus Portnoybacteria bacterium]
MSQIKKAVQILKQGGIIAYPTETVYGIGADIYNKQAIERIYKTKGRDFKKPLSVAVNSIEMIDQLADITEKDKKLIKEILPGPTTLLLPKKQTIPSTITQNSDLIGIRYPKNKKAIKIISKAKFPIASTSANKSGKKDIIRAKDIEAKVDFIVKGRCKYKQPSTIIN